MPRATTDATRLEHDVNGKLRWRRVRRVLLVSATLMAMVAMAEPSRAGEYVMRNCNVPGYPGAPLSPWTIPQGVSYRATIKDACASGGGVGFNLDEPRQMIGNTIETIGLYKPPGARSQITFVKAVLWYAARLAGSGQPLRFWSAEYRSDSTPLLGFSNGPPGSENLVGEQRLAPDTAEFRVGLACGSMSDEPCVAANRVPLLIRGMEVTLSEDVPPILRQPKGTLLDGGPQSGVRTLAFSAADPLSGLSGVDVRLNDLVVASRDLTAECFYSDFTVCPDASSETLQIDTRTLANGAYRLTLRARDAAGNTQEVHGSSTIQIANEPKPAPLDSSAFELSARFTSTSRTTLSVPYGRRVSIRGRLTQSSRPVAAGTVIEVLERRDRGRATEVSRGQVKTKADGTYSAVLVTTRPSRTVRLVYRPTADRQVVSSALALRVRAAARLRASLRGRTVRFSGRVLSRPVPRAGKRVVMEGRSPGSAWTPFKTLRTDRIGRFAGTYRLRVRRPGVRLQIRAVLPREGGYGYLGSRSPAATFRVR